MLLSHKDRSRIISDDDRPTANKIAPFKGNLLYDGFWAGVWSIRKEKGATWLTVEHVRALPDDAKGEIGEEGTALLLLHDPGGDRHEVRFDLVAK